MSKLKRASLLIAMAMAFLAAGETVYYFATGDKVLAGIYLCLVWIVMLHFKE